MALPVVAINASGSNTQASGAGPAVSLFGTGASTATSTTVTLLADNPDLSGVAVDGSAVLWVASSSGRRWSKITAVNNTAGVKTVTVEIAYANTESGKSWGIGGKRLSLDGSTQLGLDVRAGWTIDVQTNQTLTANFRITPNTASGLTFSFTSTSVTRPTLTTSTNSVCGLDFGGAAGANISNIYFQSTAGTPGNGLGLITNVATTFITINNCVVDGFAVGIGDMDAGGNSGAVPIAILNCEVKNCTQYGIWNRVGTSRMEVRDCYVHNNNTIAGAFGGMASSGPSVITGTIFDNNKAYGLQILTGNSFIFSVEHNDFTNTIVGNVNQASGLNINDGSGGTVILRNNIFWGNANLGVQGGANCQSLVNTNNAYGSNVTNRASIAVGINDVTLTANPFVSATDFGLNSTAGGGTACKGAGTANIGSANTAPDIGAIPSGGGAAAASGGPVAGNMRGGFINAA